MQQFMQNMRSHRIAVGLDRIGLVLGITDPKPTFFWFSVFRFLTDSCMYEGEKLRKCRRREIEIKRENVGKDITMLQRYVWVFHDYDKDDLVPTGFGWLAFIELSLYQID
jgi:hypothetical protein